MEFNCFTNSSLGGTEDSKVLELILRGKVLEIEGSSSVWLENRGADLLFIQCSFCGDQIMYFAQR